jgi:hypothetical protein
MMNSLGDSLAPNCCQVKCHPIYCHDNKSPTYKQFSITPHYYATPFGLRSLPRPKNCAGIRLLSCFRTTYADFSDTPVCHPERSVGCPWQGQAQAPCLGDRYPTINQGPTRNVDMYDKSRIANCATMAHTHLLSLAGKRGEACK